MSACPVKQINLIKIDIEIEQGERIGRGGGGGGGRQRVGWERELIVVGHKERGGS